ncbi:MAG: hypothetical protein E2O39_12270 [Planctomycetota bacterium]|nr:MAG: hypothetical protein E2O39_12270 [Planctomycetota bacterium]
MAPPFGAPVDAGPFGAPSGGDPGLEELVPADMFRVSSTMPAWVSPVAPPQAIEVAFLDGVPDAASVPGSVFVVDGSGTPVASTAFVAGDVLVGQPPAGGWSGALRLELHAGLASEEGALLAVPIALPILAR